MITRYIFKELIAPEERSSVEGSSQNKSIHDVKKKILDQEIATSSKVYEVNKDMKDDSKGMSYLILSFFAVKPLRG